MDWPDHTHLIPIFCFIVSIQGVFVNEKTWWTGSGTHNVTLLFAYIRRFFQHIYRRKYTEDITQPDADLQQAVHQSLDSECKGALRQRKKRKDNQATSLLWGDMCLRLVVQVVSRIVWVCIHAWVCICVFLCVQPMCTNHGSTCAYVISSTITLFWYSPAATKLH